MKKLEGKVFLGYGTGSGMGRATALLFAREGATVVVASHPENGRRVVGEIMAEGGKAILLPTDCYSESEIKAAADETMKKFGHLDIMIISRAADTAVSLKRMTSKVGSRCLSSILMGRRVQLRR